MKKYSSLDDIMNYIMNHHHYIKQQSGGINAWKMLRKPDGRRIPVEEIKNFRIFDWFADNENQFLVLDTIALGVSFKSKKKISQTARLYLYDLVVINVYDHAAEFFSKSSIDFWYMENDNSFVEVSPLEQQMLNEWASGDAGIIKAQWVVKDDEFDTLADELCIGRKIKEAVKLNRNFDMDFDVL